MKHWLVFISFYLPYERKFEYRVEARNQFRAVALARNQFRKEPTMKGKRLAGVRMTFRVEPMGAID